MPFPTVDALKVNTHQNVSVIYSIFLSQKSGAFLNGIKTNFLVLFNAKSILLEEQY